METQALQRIKKFSFPLNVYAYLLAMESGVGDVVNLHFGWFDNAAGAPAGSGRGCGHHAGPAA